MKRLIPYAGAEVQRKPVAKTYPRRPPAERRRTTLEQYLMDELARLNRELAEVRQEEAALQRMLEKHRKKWKRK
jgi:hypothetical protein